MRIFLPGQIKKDYRGDLSVVFENDSHFNRYDCFLCPTNSEEFIFLTGAGAVKQLPERVYIGVNHESGEKLLREGSHKNIGDDLREVDDMVVIPHFLNDSSELTEGEKIILDAVRKVYGK